MIMSLIAPTVRILKAINLNYHILNVLNPKLLNQMCFITTNSSNIFIIVSKSERSIVE